MGILNELTPEVKGAIIEIVDRRIQEKLINRLPSREDFSELKNIVGELAQAQKKTEERVEELAQAQKKTEERVEELAQAQKKTEERVEELAQAQMKTEERLDRVEKAIGELAQAQKRTEMEIQGLTRELKKTRSELGGLASSVGYALENEAFRALPSFLGEKYGIKVVDKLVRAEIGGEEVNLFGRGKRDGREVFIVGEVELKLTSVSKLKQLDKKVEAVYREYGEKETVKILITHFAKTHFLERAKERGVIVVQSFEW